MSKATKRPAVATASMTTAVLMGAVREPIRDALLAGEFIEDRIVDRVENALRSERVPRSTLEQVVAEVLPLMAEQTMPAQCGGLFSRGWRLPCDEAEVVRQLERYDEASEAASLAIEGEGHEEAFEALGQAASQLADVLRTFLDRQEGKWAVRFRGTIYTAPGAGDGGYGDESVCRFRVEDLETGVVDLIA